MQSTNPRIHRDQTQHVWVRTFAALIQWSQSLSEAGVNLVVAVHAGNLDAGRDLQSDSRLEVPWYLQISLFWER